MESRIVNIAIVLLILFTLFVIGMYLINPLNTSSLDPRSRVIGYHPFRISADSMSPTLKKRDIALASHWSYHDKRPERQDIITFRLPIDPAKVFLKRIIGLPGETIAIQNGDILIDGNRLAENYLGATAKQTFSLEMKEINIPDNSYFVLGDNRDNSYDSRFWGVVPYDNIEGKIIRISPSAREETY